MNTRDESRVDELVKATMIWANEMSSVVTPLRYLGFMQCMAGESPDLFLPVPSGSFSGLMIYFSTSPGEDPEGWYGSGWVKEHCTLFAGNRSPYLSVIINNLDSDAAINVIRNYLDKDFNGTVH